MNDPKYPDYGGRGIVVCERWDSFENFLADMGERATGLTIERNDNNGHYEPGNCRWATPKEQANNTRRNIVITFRGETMTLAQWACSLGMDYHALYWRIENWTLERAMTTERSPR
jgi:hypothetical protein